MSFWYGLSFDDIANMPLASIEAYLEHLRKRINEYQEMLVEPIAVPHMKDEDRRAVFERWNSETNKRTPETLSIARLRLMGVGVRRIDKRATEKDTNGR